jgi:hypothetical protein
VTAPLFRLGRIVATPGAIEVMERCGVDPTSLLGRHVAGDWGNVPPEDAELNELSVREGSRILSSYGQDDDCIWIITEADRSATTFLRPDDY